MAIDVKKIIMNSTLDLCEHKSLSKLTISHILDQSGVSRQTFYNHFKDKYDLIQYIYIKQIIPDWHSCESIGLDYYDFTLRVLQNDYKFRNFMRPACSMQDANCLRDFMYKYSKKFDREWHQYLKGPELMTEDEIFASEYHSAGTMSLRLEWIEDNYPITPVELLRRFVLIRIPLGEMLFGSRKEMDPYYLAAAKANIPGVRPDEPIGIFDI